MSIIDKVNFSILVKRLIETGLSARMVRIIYSYLTGRESFVDCGGQFSKPFIPTSGVPQGSNLGPPLFNIYVNNINKNIKAKFLMYADDAKISIAVRNQEDCQVIQDSLNTFIDNCNELQLPVNYDKCQVCTYCRRNNPIKFNHKIGNDVLKRVDSCLDLGIDFQSNLKFNLHSDKMILSFY